jgi:hypothetical protein
MKDERARMEAELEVPRHAKQAGRGAAGAQVRGVPGALQPRAGGQRGLRAWQARLQEVERGKETETGRLEREKVRTCASTPAPHSPLPRLGAGQSSQRALRRRVARASPPPRSLSRPLRCGERALGAAESRRSCRRRCERSGRRRCEQSGKAPQR